MSAALWRSSRLIRKDWHWVECFNNERDFSMVGNYGGPDVFIGRRAAMIFMRISREQASKNWMLTAEITTAAWAIARFFKSNHLIVASSDFVPSSDVEDCVHHNHWTIAELQASIEQIRSLRTV